MPAIPRLRSDLEVRPRRDGTVEVRDPRLFQIFTVDLDDWRVAEAFDGARDPAAVASVVSHRALSPHDVEALAGDFDRLHLLDSARAKEARPPKDALAPPSQMAASPPLERASVPEEGARWDCHACGACCHNLAVELSPDEDARIDRGLYADILGDGDYAEEQFLSPGEPARRVLRQRPDAGNACVFLLEDGRCAVHARQGMSAKPNACQTFPLLIVRVPFRAPRLGLRVNCASMDASATTGKTLEEHRAHAEAVFSKIPLHKIPARFQVFGVELAFTRYEAMCDELQAILALEGLTTAALRRVDRALLGGRVGRRRRRWATSIAEYVAREAAGELPIGDGAYRLALRRVPNAAECLRAIAEGEAAPSVSPEVDAYLRGQLGHVLWVGGPLHAPDAGLGLVAVMIALEAAMHVAASVPAREALRAATRAFDVFSAPALETLEHAWPVLEAIDPRYVARLREEMF